MKNISGLKKMIIREQAIQRSQRPNILFWEGIAQGQGTCNNDRNIEASVCMCVRPGSIAGKLYIYHGVNSVQCYESKY